jgi:hypothetical protein
MSHWSQDAQQKSGGTGDTDAGSPVHPCVENAKVIQVFDANEHTVLDPELKTPEAAPPLEMTLSHDDPPHPIDHDLYVAPGED